jgi:uncharacterized phiE125 gp8 family phage protein
VFTLAPVRTVAPSGFPITPGQAKQHLAVEHNEDDALIAGYISAAVAHLDGHDGILGRCLLQQTWRVDLPEFPACAVLRLPVFPVTSVVVTYFDEDEVSQTFASSQYRLYQDGGGFFLWLKDTSFWPGTFDRPDAVSITALCGAASVAEVPAPIITALLLMVGDSYRFRETAVAGSATQLKIPASATAMLAPYKRTMVTASGF